MKKWRAIAIVSFLFWLGTVSGAAFLFTKGMTYVGDDGRTTLNFDKAEKEFTLAEMRGLLETIQAIVDGASDGDMKAVGEAVKGKGVADMLKNTPKSILAKIPIRFRQLGMEMHGGFDKIGEAAKANAGKDKIVELVAGQLGRCTACHASFRMP